MSLVKHFTSVAHVEVAHLALDAARVEASSAADTSAIGDLVEHRVAPLCELLRGEGPRLAASFV